jgi:hypothetical protein
MDCLVSAISETILRADNMLAPGVLAPICADGCETFHQFIRATNTPRRLRVISFSAFLLGVD